MGFTDIKVVYTKVDNSYFMLQKKYANELTEN